MNKKVKLITTLTIASILCVGLAIQFNKPQSVNLLTTTKTSTIHKAKILNDRIYSLKGDFIIVDSAYAGIDGEKVDNKSTYKTIQAALNSIPDGNTETKIIFLKNGTYKEKLTINKPNISLFGENVLNTKITFDAASGTPLPTDPTKTYGTTGSATVTMTATATDFSAENITFENSFDEQTSTIANKQAVAVKSNADKMFFRNCKFVGNQDTLYANAGRQYFDQCHIEGDVDFIFGAAQAVFNDCDVISLDRASTTNNGYITAASTDINNKYGYLFYKCRLLSNIQTNNTVSLGRPWHPSGNVNAIASVVYYDCYMGPHINSLGWSDMSGFKASDARLFEYGSKGEGAIVSDTRRVLTDEQATEYTKEKTLNEWNTKEFIKLKYKNININSKSN